MRESGYLHLLWRWFRWFGGPFKIVRAVRGFPLYLRDWRRYRSLPGAERLLLRDSYPCLDDNTGSHGIDSQYFYVNCWAARRILSQKPDRHVDVGSQTLLAGILSASIPVVYVDYRAFQVNLSNLTSIQGDILCLPFANNSISSISCLHVAEHIGLGRYGDPLDPLGTVKACRELARILAPGGSLFFAVPVGSPRVCFNAHRIFDPKEVPGFFQGLILEEFSAVTDLGSYSERCDADEVKNSVCALGMFWFRKSDGGQVLQ